MGHWVSTGLAHLSHWKLSGLLSSCFFYRHGIHAWFGVCKSFPVIFTALYELAQPKWGTWHCPGLLLAAGESLDRVDLSAQGCTGLHRALCTTQTRRADPPRTLTQVLSPKAFTAMAPPGPNSPRKDSTILQAVRGPGVSVYPTVI